MSDDFIGRRELKPLTVHSRSWRNFTLVYPVIARRSKGLSIGVNLNPDRICNFDCIYCEVDRHDFTPSRGPIPIPPRDMPRRKVDLAVLRQELFDMLTMVKDGSIWQDKAFANVAPAMRRLNDIAFSGDGEPTTYPRFDEAIQIAIDARAAARFMPSDVKIVLITNATELSKPQVQAGLELLAQNNGEIWAKLDAGTAEYYRLIDKTAVNYERVLANILLAARQYLINIQTCMMKVHGLPPTSAEIEAYCDRLEFIRENGGRLNIIQLYTVARPPAQTYVTSLSDGMLEDIAGFVRTRTGLSVETYGGAVGL